MTDVHTKAQRSYNMSCIKGRNTRPELLLRKELWRCGYRYRLKNKLPGRPDIVFPGMKVAIFVDGCFWHKCPEHFKAPQNNAEFWKIKIESNYERDQKVVSQIKELGWNVIRIWEHEIKKDLQSTLNQIEKIFDQISSGFR